MEIANRLFPSDPLIRGSSLKEGILIHYESELVIQEKLVQRCPSTAKKSRFSHMDTPPFSELGLPDDLLAAIEILGYERPSPIQALSIPPALAGKDILGLSATGSGKTAAFALPALACIDVNQRYPQVLILCPTRELAVQVCEEVHRLGVKKKGLQATPVYGGAPMDRQLRALRDGAQLVVGTPGRLLDHLKRGSFDASRIRMAILDEADRMLDMGFKEEMDEILAALPKERQILFFSATMNRGVSTFIKKFGNNPELIEIEQKAMTVSTVEQAYYEVRQRSKVEVLSRILDMNPPRLGIIFCNTKRSVDECTEDLVNRGYAADRLHGDITQQMRERVLKRFREGAVELLVATDVAARGLDIDEIDIVFNYDLPTDPEDYVHRIGRTGRAGRFGRAVSFVFGKEIYRLQAIERYTRQVIKREKIPSVEQVEGRRADLIFETLKERLETGGFDTYQENIDRLLEQGHTPTDIAGALITMLRETSGREGEAIQEDREPDRPSRDDFKKGKGERPEPRPRPEGREGRDYAPREKTYERGGMRDAGAIEGGMTRLFISLGKGAGIMPKDIVGMMYREAGLPDGSLGRITLFPKHCLVDVPEGLADQAIQKTSNAKLRGKAFRMDHDRGPNQ
jgi:ATP-dependent RNA helicase DeaD